ncbi:Pentatricopeptide repeat [Cinnamomum micranthum f. kanehirae]|uniref:Pentatricopeptide repeat n=1 Tax=Cinnamomum micranthum f. kanehirae TaxID=337451 RepID=A0A3S3N199_9MAGN|nr:Pentatricopeptide repeat [Cinnamomum micranthum f. kanehirae]
MINRYIQIGQLEKAHSDLFDAAPFRDMMSWTSMITRVQLDAISWTIMISGHLRFKFDTILNNSLISMYGKCGDIDNARCIFDHMISRDRISWNSMIIGLFHHGLANEMLKVFESMQDMGI